MSGYSLPKAMSERFTTTRQKGNIWINLDYTAGYPGGRFMGDDVIECIYP